VVKAERNEHQADVVVASIQTLSRPSRLNALAGFSTVVVDEAHHATAPTYMKALRHLGSFEPGGPLTVGFTATPERDKGGLGAVWQKVAHYKSIREMIFEGYLSPVRAQTVETSFNLRHVRVNRGDFHEGDLGAELINSGALDEIADAYVEHAADRKGVAFLPTIETAQGLALALSARGIATEAVWAGQSLAERRGVLARLRSGETRCVTNCSVLTEGFDESSIDCIVVARATKSHPLYIQMVGRGLRKHLGKKDCLILDMVGATLRHTDLIAFVDLDEYQPDVRDGEGQNCTECNIPLAEGEVSEGAQRHAVCYFCELCNRGMGQGRGAKGHSRHDGCESLVTVKLDPLASKLRWLQVDGGYCLGSDNAVIVMAPVDDESWQLVEYGRNARIEVLRAHVPLDWAQGIGEDRAKAFGKLTQRNATWLTKEPTDAQRSRLVREGLPEEKLRLVRTRGEAANLLTRIQGRRCIKKLAHS
jgi:hypothetical protein